MLRYVAILSVLAACGTPGEVPKDAPVDTPPSDAEVDAPPPCAIGDVTQPIELAFGHYEITTGQLVPVGNMMPLPITLSEQGGFTMRVGVRARNVHCTVQSATIALFDTCPGDKLLKVESRAPVLLVEGSDGWGTPLNLGSYMQLHACPYPDLPRHMKDVPYEIQLAIEDGGRTAQGSLHVIPYCADSDEETRALCECFCNKDYVLGAGCPPPSSGEPPVCDP
jgi:hypothetical protein